MKTFFSPTRMSQVCSGKSCINRNKEKKTVFYLHPEGRLEELQCLRGSVFHTERTHHHTAERRHPLFKELKKIYVYMYIFTLFLFITLLNSITIKTYLGSTIDLHRIEEPVAAYSQQVGSGVLVHGQRSFQLRWIFLKINETMIIHFLRNYF